jgi:hypothetical protein
MTITFLTTTKIVEMLRNNNEENSKIFNNSLFRNCSHIKLVNCHLKIFFLADRKLPYYCNSIAHITHNNAVAPLVNQAVILKALCMVSYGNLKANIQLTSNKSPKPIGYSARLFLFGATRAWAKSARLAQLSAHAMFSAILFA